MGTDGPRQDAKSIRLEKPPGGAQAQPWGQGLLVVLLVGVMVSHQVK